MTTLSVVIPAYNEENGIADIIERVLGIKSALTGAGVDQLELLVVDDGSADATVAITSRLSETHPELRLVQHEHNKGYGAALKTGFSMARGELIGFLDADGTYPPEHFPQLCARAIAGSELVIGSRMAGAASQMPLTRRVGNLFFARLLSLLGRQTVSDSASGMRVMRREILERLLPLPDGLNLTPVMSARAIHENIVMDEVPIPYSERVGRSKLSVVHDGSLFLRSMLWTVLEYNPVRILGSIGLFLIGVALMCVIGLVVARLNGITRLGPWGVASILTGAISGVVGVSVIALGITFNYLVALFHRTPVRQGLFNKPILSKPLDIYFHWIGAMSIVTGAVTGLVSLLLALQGWQMERLWLYGLASAMSIVLGTELIIFWIILRTLETLNERNSGS